MVPEKRRSPVVRESPFGAGAGISENGQRDPLGWILEIEVEPLVPGPSFDVCYLPGNALPVLDCLFGVVAVFKNALASFFFPVFGPRAVAQASMDSTAILAFHGRALALTTASCFCETATSGPVWSEPPVHTSQNQEIGVSFC